MHNKPRRQNNNGGGRHFQNNRNGGRRYSKGGSGGNFNTQGGENDTANVARVRRHAQTNREKFMNLARDAMGGGDRVLAEYYLQHAEHYFRVLSALPPEEQRQRHHNQQQAGEGQPAAEGQQQPQADGAQGAPEREEPVVNTSGSALPSFITGVRDMPRAAGDE